MIQDTGDIPVILNHTGKVFENLLNLTHTIFFFGGL
jgi:hypothetical protein